MEYLIGIGTLLLTLALFTLFSLKFPKGSKAMTGLAHAAIASFLVEAICKYILGDYAGLPLFGKIGISAGSMSGTAAAILVGLAMGTDPVIAVSSGTALAGFGILPGFIAGYVMHFISLTIKKYLPKGVNTIIGALVSSVCSYAIAVFVNPGVTAVISQIGRFVTAATIRSPLVMGFLLGGIMKIICTSPLSSMALTAMLGLTGIPMGIAAIACFGGTFTNGILFVRLHLGSKSQAISVMVEPLTQANIITRNPIPIYVSDMIGGGFSGLIAAGFGIINNAPGTAAPIPGMLAPFAFNPVPVVLTVLVLSALAGILSGLIGSVIFERLRRQYLFLYTPWDNKSEE